MIIQSEGLLNELPVNLRRRGLNIITITITVSIDITTPTVNINSTTITNMVNYHY